MPVRNANGGGYQDMRSKRTVLYAADLDLSVPDLPAGEWSEHARQWWENSHLDPVASLWDAGERLKMVTLLPMFERTLDPLCPNSVRAELRKAEDNLGLTNKGKRSRGVEIVDTPAVERYVSPFISILGTQAVKRTRPATADEVTEYPLVSRRFGFALPVADLIDPREVLSA